MPSYSVAMTTPFDIGSVA